MGVVSAKKTPGSAGLPRRTLRCPGRPRRPAGPHLPNPASPSGPERHLGLSAQVAGAAPSGATHSGCRSRLYPTEVPGQVRGGQSSRHVRHTGEPRPSRKQAHNGPRDRRLPSASSFRRRPHAHVRLAQLSRRKPQLAANSPESPDSCLGIQLPFLMDASKMLVDGADILLIQLRHQHLRQPDRLP